MKKVFWTKRALPTGSAFFGLFQDLQIQEHRHEGQAWELPDRHRESLPKSGYPEKTYEAEADEFFLFQEKAEP
jgi:hypothetical protein